LQRTIFAKDVAQRAGVGAKPITRRETDPLFGMAGRTRDLEKGMRRDWQEFAGSLRGNFHA
jgi:hypothetical protein